MGCEKGAERSGKEKGEEEGKGSGTRLETCVERRERKVEEGRKRTDD